MNAFSPRLGMTSPQLLLATIAVVALSTLFLVLGPRPSKGSSASDDPNPRESVSTDEVKQKTLLVPSACEFDFGVLPRGGRHRVRFWLQNPGITELVVNRVRTSCECFQVRLSQERIEPGSRVAADAEVDFTDDPAFTGRLCLEANGVTGQEAAPAFTISVTVMLR